MGGAREKVAFLGAGAVSEALVGGALAGGLDPGAVWVTARSRDHVDALSASHGVRGTTDNAAAASEAGIVVLAVPAAGVAQVLDEIAGRLRDGAVVVSLADGVPLAELEERLPEGVGAARAMPSLTARAGEGLTLLTPGASCSAAQADAAAGLFERSGKVVRVAEEQHAVLGPLSSGGPAYVLYLAEAMIEAGAVRGVPRDLARELVTQVLTGTAAWLREDSREVATLREKVCAPGGAGIRRIAALDRHAVRAAVVSALGDAPPGLTPG
ncbi:delta 1-pyrroline-5-carboxylate reductase [Streptomyces sp. FR-008]|nr:delta 1-pyrroline-5-carboxylate reductase [Streptomyces sp. FR-008]KAF0795400.1 delta 1-pyrroline-5-carboxylate reductase [Streptomyces sp. FR-008]